MPMSPLLFLESIEELQRIDDVSASLFLPNRTNVCMCVCGERERERKKRRRWISRECPNREAK
jgi:hypothetical protein